MIECTNKVNESMSAQPPGEMFLWMKLRFMVSRCSTEKCSSVSAASFFEVIDAGFYLEGVDGAIAFGELSHSSVVYVRIVERSHDVQQRLMAGVFLVTNAVIEG